ncbi:hypothetical protein P171DRAFT_505260 [Karstenula rhodostoma CBS 690.94]|uniref:MYND-type domain-containing protein n=1 Tax=Karstenula rhodostoma CBS 690.94 TaxID=1392251 RepID=A0A9P4P6B0_9PLEO|nr:hypothetical protein P171DRAFT_505260 [Karstenula rhodostoma CBS 690.94]
MSSDLVISCMVCGKQDNLKQCAQCKLVHFCGQEHQRSHWPSHKAVCKKVAKLRKRLEEKQKIGRESWAEMTGGLSLQFTGSRRDGVQYKEQLQLAEQELEIDTLVAIESALNHVVDLRNVPFQPLSDDVLEMATSCLIRLGRDQEAYNYLKHWVSRYKDHDVLESPDIFEGRAPSAAFLASVFLVKLRLFTAAEAARHCYTQGGDCSNPLIVATLKKCGLDYVVNEGPELGDQLNNTIRMLQDQMEELYLQVKQLQPDFWSKLPTVHENREPRHDNSGMETQPVLHCYRAFAATRGSFEFVQSFTTDPA